MKASERHRTASSVVGTRRPPGLIRGLLRSGYLATISITVLLAAANSAAGSVRDIAQVLKWIPIIVFGAGGLFRLLAQCRHVQQAPPTVLDTVLRRSIWLFLGALGTSTALNGNGVASWLLVAATIASLVAAWDTAKRSESPWISKGRVEDAMAHFSFAVVVVAATMWVMGISLGRGRNRFSAWFDNPNTLGAFCTVTFVVLLGRLRAVDGRRRTQRAFHIGALLVSGSLGVASGSRASVAAIIWALLLYVFLSPMRIGKAPRIAVSALALGALAVGLPVQNVEVEIAGRSIVAETGRGELWPYALELSREKPFFGFGAGTSKALIETVAGEFRVSQGLHFHNSYLTVLVEGGTLALVPFLAAIAVAVVAAFRTLKTSHHFQSDALLVLVLPIHSIAESMLSAPGSVYFFVFWVCVFRCLIRERYRWQTVQQVAGRIAGYRLAA